MIDTDFDAAIEAGLNLVPYVGGSLASLYSNHKNNKRFERIEDFYQNLKKQMVELDQTIIDRINSSQQDPELLASLIEKQHEVIETEYINYKKQFLQSYFINNLIMETTYETFDKKVMYLDALKNLNLSELEILILLFQQNKPQQISGIEFKENSNKDRYTIVGHVNRLRNYGFIELYTGNVTIGGNVDNIHDSIISISDFGKEFVSFCLL
ncbi:hypothetical protein [Oceanobacillus aidingensis]|uniref:Uncharacterized protein n=1 Tax=Oceanobacillus aidingensis TaxID=645964 RepID=A0ABV9JVG9_9BACI